MVRDIGGMADEDGGISICIDRERFSERHSLKPSIIQCCLIMPHLSQFKLNRDPFAIPVHHWHHQTVSPQLITTLRILLPWGAMGEVGHQSASDS